MVYDVLELNNQVLMSLLQMAEDIILLRKILGKFVKKNSIILKFSGNFLEKDTN